jgi:hypothetical protein
MTDSCTLSKGGSGSNVAICKWIRAQKLQMTGSCTLLEVDLGPKADNDRQLHTFQGWIWAQSLQMTNSCTLGIGGSGPNVATWRWIGSPKLKMTDSCTLLEVDLGPKAANDRPLRTSGGGSGPRSCK